MCIKIYDRNLDTSWPAFNGGETTSDWHVTLSLVYIYITLTHVYAYAHMCRLCMHV